ncbi:HET domain-containing protein [Aspergillus luchuensis]|uniref:Heterokaryon incompatibility domain-containing protein n=1 Tax=Aspergillus kawachii TaxID=1069201 RepID=A0A146FP57_ASPKA|nr:uncharacterized protein AKAW2_20401S [Aspergillus luchuensis]BCR95461.1 hypothetical protein AKAW2_20401S [Aspergillus luchuensis]BCS08002.1 hypothetical protein ALUC_20372S [Aspergillus luchuensis]GAT27545.1 hypothetical protein RIB2604_02112390 [Aspergillus luchuensis]
MPLSYNKLDPSAKQIRLLTIFPDENDENLVRASLHTVSLNDACDFEALSYVWGDTSVTVDISVDDCIIGVTANLHAFLRGLRQPDTERTVWVDYVCINQNDISERNSQVPLMCQIYSTATSVVAWLGDLEPEALKLIEWYHANQDGLYYNSTGLHDIFEAIAVLCLSANALCTAQYWHRLWTFQEWHLSRNAVVCMHGKTTFIIGNFFERLNDEIVAVRRFVMVLTSSGGALSIADTFETEDLYNFIRFLLERQQELDSLLNKIPRDILLLNRDTPRPSRLGDLLLLTVDRHCSNQLDNVYALYGLSPAAREAYPPDYRKTISQVNHETTCFVLGHEANISIFDDFDFCFNSSNKEDSLPSWVVDFTTTDPAHRAKMQQNFSKSLHLNKAPWKPIQDHAPIVTDNMHTLKLWCQRIGVASPPYLFESPALDCLGQVQALAKTAARPDNIFEATFNYTGCYSYFIPDTFLDIMKISVSDEHEKFLEATKGSLPALRLCFEKLTEKRFFTMATSSGRSIVGFTDCEIEEGDHIVVPCGIVQVFVLRPIPEKMLVDGEKAQCFKVIGRAFVESISHPEGTTPDPLRSELKRTPATQFCVR